jgi:hypothetical protein
MAFAVLFFLLCLLLVSNCAWAAGRTLGLFLGPPALFGILLPQTVSVLGRASQRWMVWLLACLAPAIIWFFALPGMPGTNARQVAFSLIILSSFNLLLIALTDALLWSGIRPTAAAALVTLISLAWLSWPIWLSGHLAGRAGASIANDLVWAHPLFAMNATLHPFDSWDHYPFMYSTLTTLNQDVPYRIPQSIWPAVLIHAIPAVVILSLHPLLAREIKLNRQGAKTPS